MTSRVRVPGRRRRRGLALAAATALVGVPLLVAGPTASAESAGTVTFSGGCGLLGSGLGSRSSPDTEQVSLPAGSELRFANQLGQAATLRLDGEEAADIPDGGSADVVFHQGPVMATMQIDCLLGESAGAVTVAVADPPQAQPEPPSGSGGTAAPSPGGEGPSGSDAPSGSGASPAEPGSAADQPSGAWWPGTPAAPGDADRPTREAPADPPSGPADGLSPRWGLATEPAHGSGSPGDPANVAPPPAGEFADDELTRTSGSVPGDGPVGLLALVASVCVVGVASGAVRALISQRASRAAVS
ncbi:MAG: hypothetical protein GEV12_20135 [Micromonosporaceae bacterium]|nr:hypothetical protein [Micromonosporaceae bacterium]